MKCTNKPKKRLSKKAQRKRKIRRTLFRSRFFVILLLAGVLGIFMLKGKQAVDAPMAFKLTTEVFGQTIGEDSLVAEGVAAGLCVGAGDTPLEGIETQGEERAALFDIKDKILSGQYHQDHDSTGSS